MSNLWRIHFGTESTFFFPLAFFFLYEPEVYGDHDQPAGPADQEGTSVQRLDAKLAVEKFQLPTGRCRVPEVSPSLFFFPKGQQEIWREVLFEAKSNTEQFVYSAALSVPFHALKHLGWRRLEPVHGRTCSRPGLLFVHQGPWIWYPIVFKTDVVLLH